LSFFESHRNPALICIAMSPDHNNGGFMIDVQATYYRRRAIVARQSAAAAMDPYVKAAFAEVANHWLGLAEHIEWLHSIRRGSHDRASGDAIISLTAHRGS
jgi:hypothetical protein